VNPTDGEPFIVPADPSLDVAPGMHPDGLHLAPDMNWMDVGEPYRVYVDAFDGEAFGFGGRGFASTARLAYEGKFASRIAQYRAEDKPVAYQSRVKFHFTKNNVSPEWKSCLMLGSGIEIK